MTHDVFGNLKYRERSGEWVGQAPLPRFAAVGWRAPAKPPTEEEIGRQIAEMKAAMENMKQLMTERFGDRAAAAFAEVDRAADAELARIEEEGDLPPNPHEEERERRRAERERKKAARLAKGLFPVRVAAPEGAEPTAAQAAAFRHLLEKEPAVFDAVRGQIWDSFRSAYEQEHWRMIADVRPAAGLEDLAGRFSLTRLEVTRESRGGFAHLVFTVDSDWEDEHGLFVVYSPDTREAAWTSHDGLGDLTTSDDPGDREGTYTPTPHEELVEAVLAGDDERARQLVAAGADVNALGPDEYPPLWLAVEHMEVENVRRLLEYGADPELANADEGTTPLKHARRLYKQMGFAPSRKRDALLDAMMAVAREAAGGEFETIGRRLEEIIRLLEEARR